MIIALFGASCTGKTTLARELAERLSCPLRSCGDEVRCRASALGVSMDELPMAEHAEIDKATRTWLRSIPVGVVEGRFLDQVLATVDVQVKLVCVQASSAERAARWSIRRSELVTENGLKELDAADDAFRSVAYGAGARMASYAILSNSGRTVEDCLEELLNEIRR